MAILIEQEKQRLNLFAIVSVATFILIIAIAIYYLFFINPAIIANITYSPRLKTLQDVQRMQSSINPDDIMNSGVYKNLKIQIQPITPESAGNSNPFRTSI